MVKSKMMVDKSGKVIEQGVARHERDPMMNPDRPVYLDHNATTPILPEVVDAMLPYLREHFGNPSSGHVYGQHAREAVALSRHRVATLLGCDDEEVLFTSGGTESNNLAIRGVTEAVGKRRHVITTVIEHPATANPCRWLEQHGWRVTRVAVDADGRTRLDDVRRALDADTALVTVMHSNNETGVLQPVAELAEWAHAVGAMVHTDAAQSVGKVQLHVKELAVDLLSVAGHKLYAPKGVGALYVKRGTPLLPFALGADHERGLRPGTENVASIVGLGVACEVVRWDLETAAARMRGLRDTLWTGLASGIPGLALNGDSECRLPNALNVRFPGTSGSAVLAGAPEIAASTGSACHDGGEAASAVILAMGIAPADAVGSVRLTLGRGTTEDDVARASASLICSWRRLHERDKG
jgi:cysteine desulfurase